MAQNIKWCLLAVTVLIGSALVILAINFTISTLERDQNALGGADSFNASETASVPAGTSSSLESDGALRFLSKRGYINEHGCPTVIGEVENGGNGSMKDVLLTASFYCSRGKLLGAREDLAAVTADYAEIPVLAPGETSPFKIALSIEELVQLENFDVDKIEKFTVDGAYIATEETLYRQFETQAITGSFENVTGQYLLQGTVKNVGTERPDQIKVVVTFYDAQRKILEVLHTSLSGSLSPGTEAEFAITVTDRTIAERIETYAFQVVGL